MALRPTLICDDQVAFAVVGSSLSVLMVDAVPWTPALVDALYDETAAHHPRVPHGLAVILGDPPAAAARVRMGERQREIEDGGTFDTMQYTAVVIESGMARGILTAFGWLTRLQKTRAFAPGNEVEAIAWLCGQVGGDPDALFEAMRGCRAAIRGRRPSKTG
ncbi:MAG: STAS/SEC14 domain-containing protein [Myxococcales bacterium]|nr:STAS/SEC14 domain-containing protein [Myxococcales bacterium]